MRQDRRVATWLVVGTIVVASFAIALMVLVGRPSSVVVAVVAPPSRDAHAVAALAPVRNDAPRLDAEPDTATVERPSALVELEESGEGSEAWSSQGTALLDAFGASSAAMTERGCFVAGCAALFTFSSEDDYQRQLARLVASDAYAAWTGGKVLSPLQLRADHKVVVSLVLYRPD
jgi:hypothetical protein